MNRPHVALIDDDEAVLDSLGLYLRNKGFGVCCFASAGGFLEALADGTCVDCIVSDVRMPGLSGLELQHELAARGSRCPLILITGHGDIDTAVTAVKAGAHDFLQKPFDEQRLIAAIEDAASLANRQNVDGEEMAQLKARVAELSERQRRVMDLAVRGLTNKEIAAELDISARTVESYRSWVMERTGAKNLADLVRIAMRLGIAG